MFSLTFSLSNFNFYFVVFFFCFFIVFAGATACYCFIFFIIIFASDFFYIIARVQAKFQAFIRCLCRFSLHSHVSGSQFSMVQRHCNRHRNHHHRWCRRFRRHTDLFFFFGRCWGGDSIGMTVFKCDIHLNAKKYLHALE